MNALTLAAQGRTVAALVLIGIGVAVAAWSVASILQRRRISHRASWRRVAQRLGLSGPDAALLDRAALAAGLRTPLSLIVSDRCYDRAVRMYERRAGTNRRLTAIRQLIYEPAPTPRRLAGAIHSRP